MPHTPPHIGTTERQAVGLPPVGQMLHCLPTFRFSLRAAPVSSASASVRRTRPQMLTCACVAAVSGRLDHHSTGHRDHPGHHDRSAADAHVTSMQQPRAQPHSPSNHASTDDAETAGSRVSLWPSNSSIALLLRGQAFRDRNAVSHAHHESRRGTRPPHSGSCEAHTTQRQLSQGQSLVHNVIRPLEERGNRVDLFVTETSGSCALVPQLLRSCSSCTGRTGSWRATLPASCAASFRAFVAASISSKHIA